MTDLYMGTERRGGKDRRSTVAAEHRVSEQHDSSTTEAQSLAAVSPIAARVDTHGHVRSTRAEDGSLVRLVLPGLLIGAGLGGLIDDVVFHHLVQWHHVTSTAFIPGHLALESTPDALMADGVVELLSATAIVLGVLLLWAAGQHAHTLWRHAGGSLVGWMMAGWSAYNVLALSVPALAFDRHHVNVVGGGQVGWDLAWLGVSLVIGVVGLGLAMQARPRDTVHDDWAG